MIKFKYQFYCDTCQKQAPVQENMHPLPDEWRHMITYSGTYHFCSDACYEVRENTEKSSWSYGEKTNVST